MPLQSVAHFSTMDRIQPNRRFIHVVHLDSSCKVTSDPGIGQPAATKTLALLARKLGA
jgi:hypothetical protein